MPMPEGQLVVVVGNLTIDDVVLPTGATRMATLGGNCVHAATAVITAGARAALVARRGEDFPPGALAALADEGADVSGLVDIAGPTVRNWVVYEADGRRHWLYRTPPGRSAQVAPEPGDLGAALLSRAAVVHVAAMPLGNAERIVAHVRRQAPGARITLDTHESWDASVADRVLELARAVDVFVPSKEELAALVDAGAPAGASAGGLAGAPAGGPAGEPAGEPAGGPAAGLRALAAHGICGAVVKAAEAGAYLLDDHRVVHVPALQTSVEDSTGAGDAFCGGLAAGLARGLSVLDSVALGAAVAGTAITASGSLRLLEVGRDRAGISAAGRQLAAAAAEVRPEAEVRRPLDQRGRISAHTTEKRPRKTEPARTAAEPSRTTTEPARTTTEPARTTTEPARTATGSDRSEPDQRYDIDVMRREISMIPDVVSDVLDDAHGHITALAKRLAARGIQHLWLTGCGDSAFAGLAAELAFQRHSGLTAHPVHALDLARYRVRALPADSAVIALSFSGSVGRTIEAATQARRAGHHVIALTNAADGQLALASSEVLPVEVPTLGFSPGSSTYVAMLGTLLRLAAAFAELRGDSGGLMRKLARLPAQVEATLAVAADPSAQAAEALLPARWVAFLGAGPNEATARFGAAKLLEGPQRLGVATNLEEWAHEEYFVTSAGDPVVLVNPSGAGHDRGEEILSELRFMAARPLVISDRPLPAGGPRGELLLPLAADVPEELSPVTACLPPALAGFHLARLAGKQSYNFPGEAARTEHYETIHRATIGDPA